MASGDEEDQGVHQAFCTKESGTGSKICGTVREHAIVQQVSIAASYRRGNKYSGNVDTYQTCRLGSTLPPW